MMTYVLYIVAAVLVVWLSKKASEYVDMLDKLTKLSGAFIGAIMLSAVTSLPELFTSITSTLMLNKPGLCMGNILGSDLFNLTAISIMILLSYKVFGEGNLSRSHTMVAVSVLLIYLMVLANMEGFLDFNLLTVSITSWAILACYLISLKFMTGEDGTDTQIENTKDVTSLSVGQVGIRFAMVSIGIIVVSIFITYLTDDIAGKLHLGNGLAGAIFLGVATSLPEASSTFTLFKIRNYDIAMGNIIGSNLFNFLILFVVDVLYFGNGIYDFSDPQTINLLVFGAIASLLAFLMLQWKNKVTQVICPFGIIACYAAFLLV